MPKKRTVRKARKAFDDSILVTGDVIADTDIYVGERVLASNVAAEGTVIRCVPGGARLLFQLIEKLVAASGTGTETRYGFNEPELKKPPEYLKAHALYGRQTGGTIKDPSEAKVWRVTNALGYGTPPLDADEPDLTRAKVSKPPRIVVIDDGGAGFRSIAASNRWPFAVPAQKRRPAEWIVLKMAKPLAQGDLWRTLSGQFGSQSDGFADRLITIVNAESLRFHETGISRGLSWEKTVREICEELESNVSVRPLRRSRHLLIVFRHEGVLWFDTRKPAGEGVRLIFDPSLCEGEWETTLADPSGDVFGHLTVFTAFVAAELARRPQINNDSFENALTAGIEAMRTLRMVGHEPDPNNEDSNEPGFPFSRLVALSTEQNSGELKSQLAAIQVPCSDEQSVPGNDWTIIAHHERRHGASRALFGTAMQVALKGSVALKKVPQASFGKLLSIDRDEMEALRALRRTIRRYVNDAKERKPLALAVFGPPGSGKSFGVEEIADEVFSGKACILKFNLSQFTDSAELIGAFHQVRDKVLEGFVPVVFWDEFDSNEYKWLQYFLAPLEDGKFQSGQITHAISRCIFVFAGGTSCDFEHFGPTPEPRTTEEQKALNKRHRQSRVREADEKRRTDFILKKGPDFVSRLDAHFNVLGINQRQEFDFEKGKWDGTDTSDVGYPIRRALLIRSVLRLDNKTWLQIEPALLAALLRVSKYRHSTRSLKKIVLLLQTSPGEPLRRANLPSRDLLARHIEDVEELDQIFAETELYRSDENLLRLAAAVAESYLRFVKGDPPDPKYRNAFDKLDPWRKATNVAAAARLPEILALAGLRLVPGKATPAEETAVRKQLEHHLEVLGEHEHKLWMNFHVQNGWIYSPTKDPEKRRHNLLVPYDKLSDDEKPKDHQVIRSYPDLARLAGYKIVFLDDTTRKSRSSRR
jgi:DNA polymerase III delta prime subunit